jgi:mRNA interferase HigB
VRVTSRKAIREFIEAGNVKAEAALGQWYRLISNASWTNFAAVRAACGRRVDRVKVASGKDVYVFNVGGNNYRVVAAIHFNVQRLFVLRVMTHADYDKNEWSRNL